MVSSQQGPTPVSVMGQCVGPNYQPDQHVCFRGPGAHNIGRYCGNFWHETHGYFLPVFLQLYARSLLCPRTQVRFAAPCGEIFPSMLSAYVNTSHRVERSCAASDIVLRYDETPVEYWGRDLKRKVRIDGGLLKCDLFTFNRTLNLRQIHVFTAWRLGLPPRSARPLSLLLNLRGSEQRRRSMLNPNQVSSALHDLAHEYDTHFVSITSGAMKMIEQLRAFGSADVYVSYHGSANVAAFWLPADSVVVEIQPGDSWHCANAYFELQLIYILATTRRLASLPGSCPPELVAKFRCGLPAGTCPAYELTRRPYPGSPLTLQNHRWGFHHTSSRNVSIPGLSKLTRAILESYRRIREHPDRLSVSPALARMTAAACMGKARNFAE
mmetsp:Transcript_22635/g.37396  ORF Transcript_22635/g.37396 Transcript_22635/m.37396 type:complete len:382 (-) Transcript_22635:8-1153(-)